MKRARIFASFREGVVSLQILNRLNWRKLSDVSDWKWAVRSRRTSETLSASLTLSSTLSEHNSYHNSQHTTL